MRSLDARSRNSHHCLGCIPDIPSAMAIWLAVVVGSVIATAVRRVGEGLSARLDADLLLLDRRLHNHRIDCFILGILPGAISMASANAEVRLSFGLGPGLLLGFAAFLGSEVDLPRIPCPASQRAVRRIRRLVLGPAAVVAGWLCAGAVAHALFAP